VVDLISQAVIAFIAVRFTTRGSRAVSPSNVAPPRRLSRWLSPNQQRLSLPRLWLPARLWLLRRRAGSSPALAHAVAAVPAPAPKPAESLAPELRRSSPPPLPPYSTVRTGAAVQQAFMPTPHLNVWALKARPNPWLA